MIAMANYLFTSDRLGFRDWATADIPLMAAINADPVAMQYFPRTQTMEDTIAFVSRMQTQLKEKGYCYYAVDALVDNTFIGFIGISWQSFTSPCTPAIDVGWRLSPLHWGKGYATEGALRCLAYGFEQLQIPRLIAIAPAVNVPSIRVMQKAGMHFCGHFDHPMLQGDERLEDCVWYEMSAL